MVVVTVEASPDMAPSLLNLDRSSGYQEYSIPRGLALTVHNKNARG